MNEPEPFLCEVCGLPLAVGEWPCVITVRPHGRLIPTPIFVPYFDVALGREIGSFADRWRAMKEMDLVDRPKMSQGDVSARKDRVHEQRKEEGRG